MNADGSAAVSADVSAGAEVPALQAAIAALFLTVALLLVLGAVLIYRSGPPAGAIRRE